MARAPRDGRGKGESGLGNLRALRETWGQSYR